MNSVGKEYKQLGGDYKVMHHTEYLETLVKSGKLVADSAPTTVAYHDPCYLGRHNGVYEAPRNLLNILSNTTVELPRNRENSFCCGAGGAQFWKEEEEGAERISDNRYREAQTTLVDAGEKVLAVGCPFCKSMLESTPAKGADTLAVRDVAELLLEGVQRRAGLRTIVPTPVPQEQPVLEKPAVPLTPLSTVELAPQPVAAPVLVRKEVPVEAAQVEQEMRKKWAPKTVPQQTAAVIEAPVAEPPLPPATASEPKRKAWTPKQAAPKSEPASPEQNPPELPAAAAPVKGETPKRKAWTPKKAAPVAQEEDVSPE